MPAHTPGPFGPLALLSGLLNTQVLLNAPEGMPRSAPAARIHVGNGCFPCLYGPSLARATFFFPLDDAPSSFPNLALNHLCPTSFCTDPYACSLTSPLPHSSCADQNLYETCPRACDMRTVSLQSADKTVSNSSAMLPPWYHTHTIPAPTIRWTTFLPFPSSCFYHPT